MIRYQDSRKSIQKYIEWRASRSQPAVAKISKYLKIKDAKILEIGCGYGPLLPILAKKGAQVVGTEIDKNTLAVAKKFIGNNKNIKLVQVHNDKLPFKNSTFDSIIMFDVIEHVKNPKTLIEEVYRVLKDRGGIYIEFTPYYSFIGHHLYDITLIPVQILPDKFIKSLIYTKGKCGLFSPKQYWDNFRSLNRIKISTYKKYINHFQAIEENYIFKLPNMKIKLPFLKYFGPFADLLTFSFEGVYRKLTPQ